MNKRIKLNKKKERRKTRTRAKIYGGNARPRFSVFRSSRHTYVQIIDDEKGLTLASASTKELKTKGKKSDKSLILGELIAKKAVDKGIKKVIFDRGHYKYHGRVKNIAEGARKAGLIF